MVLDLSVFKNLLAKDDGDTSEDTMLTFILSSAEQLVEKEIKIYLTSKQIIESRLGNDSMMMMLYWGELQSIDNVEAITFSTSTNSINVPVKIDILDNFSSQIFNSYMFKGGILYKITYTSGYATKDDIPFDLRYAIYEIAVKLYSLTEFQKQGVSKMTTPDGTFYYSSKIIPESIMSILNKYKRSI